VIATDINPRVIHWLSMSLILNEINNIEIRLGDLYEPVKENKFDYIMANPPFVITRKPHINLEMAGNTETMC
jgi:methylase of polypeptide subunit release factors